MCQQHLDDDLTHCREMLRIKRSVAASFSQVHYNTTLVEAATTPAAPGMPLLWHLLVLMLVWQHEKFISDAAFWTCPVSWPNGSRS